MTVPTMRNTPFCTVVSTCRHVQQTLNGLPHYAMNTFGKSVEGAQQLCREEGCRAGEVWVGNITGVLCNEHHGMSAFAACQIPAA